MDRNFWKTKSIDELSPDEWEALCDGCGRCCLYKLEDEDGNFYYTRVACKFLDIPNCRCTSYENRRQVMPSCIALTPELAHSLTWLPRTCAYRLLALNENLPDWHPLISKDNQGAQKAGISVRDFAIPEGDADLDNLEKDIIDDY